MTQWAVGYISFIDNDMSIEITFGETWIDALNAHSKVHNSGHMEDLPTDIDEAKQEFFNQDAMFDVKEITT